jgi:hypothetical protein
MLILKIIGLVYLVSIVFCLLFGQICAVGENAR